MRARFAEGGVLLVLALTATVGRGQQDAASLDVSDVLTAPVELIALEEAESDVVKSAVCSGSSCGLCNQPCADACCGTGNETKPPCCSQTAAPTITTPFIAARPVVSTPCPSCELCPSILAATYVEPGLADCCNANPCGSKKLIENTPNGTNATSTLGVNPYGANWTYEKHVKKHGVDITKYAQTPLQKAAAALAAKDSEEVANQAHAPPANGSSNGSLNTSTTPGVPIILLPPNITVADWEMPPKDITVSQNSSDMSDMDALMNSMPKANISLVEVEEDLEGIPYVGGNLGAEGNADVTDVTAPIIGDDVSEM